MHRTQISLEEKQYNNLRRYAQTKKQSISAVIRALLDQYVPDSQSDEVAESPLQQLKGIVSGKGESRGREHNALLYNVERRWNKKK